MPNDGVKVCLEADTGPLDAALKRVERSVSGLSGRLELGFRFLDLRISQLRKSLAGLESQAQKSGPAISSAIEGLSTLMSRPPLSGLACRSPVAYPDPGTPNLRG